MSKYSSVRSFSAKHETLDRLEELSKRYDMSLSGVITMLINQDYERLQGEINGFIQTKLHARSIEERRRFSSVVNTKTIQRGLSSINQIDLNNEDDLLCPHGSKCQICEKRYITEQIVNSLAQRYIQVIGVKR